MIIFIIFFFSLGNLGRTWMSNLAIAAKFQVRVPILIVTPCLLEASK